jgi:phage portal protein BeeE
LIEQLKWTAEVVCSTYHVPPYKIGIGAMPVYNNVQALNTEYYSQCLQVLIEAIELCLDEGLGMAENSRHRVRP